MCIRFNALLDSVDHDKSMIIVIWTKYVIGSKLQWETSLGQKRVALFQPRPHGVSVERQERIVCGKYDQV